MQNSKIVETLANAIDENVNSKYSFVIDNNQIDKVIGDAKNNLEINNYMIKHVEIVFYTAQIIVVRGNTYSSVYGWESKDCALMFSCIKKIYRERELIFDGTK